MTLEQLAYAGQIFAALGIIASLIYLARQVGQNTAMMRVAASSEGVERDSEIVAPLLQNRELAEIWIRGEAKFSSLDPADQARLVLFERRAIVLRHHRFQLHQQGLVPDAAWHEQI